LDHNPPTSASQVAGITDKYHYTQPLSFFPPSVSPSLTSFSEKREFKKGNREKCKIKKIFLLGVLIWLVSFLTALMSFLVSLP
jgi:hypothetical protein